MIFKVLVRARLTIDGNMGSLKPLIVSTIHNIPEVGAIMLVFTSIEHGMSKLLVSVEGLELWDDNGSRGGFMLSMSTAMLAVEGTSLTLEPDTLMAPLS